jgi:hypothetical protein
MVSNATLCLSLDQRREDAQRAALTSRISAQSGGEPGVLEPDLMRGSALMEMLPPVVGPLVRCVHDDPPDASIELPGRTGAVAVGGDRAAVNGERQDSRL